MGTGDRLRRSVELLGDDRRVDRAVQLVERVTKSLPAHGAAHDLLRGTWLGHTLHPMLTDLPIGFWTSAWCFDLLGNPKYDEISRNLIGLGILSAIPTALAGASDWNETSGAARRVGAVHAVANTGALALYVGSWSARRRGRRSVGVALAMVGATFATVGGYLGGHLVAVLGAGVEHHALTARVDARP